MPVELDDDDDLIPPAHAASTMTAAASTEALTTNGREIERFIGIPCVVMR
jgi:hypothetical protein